MKTYGLDWLKECKDRKYTDWEHQLGGTLDTCLVTIPEHLREEYLPKGEVQRSSKGDMMDCATRAPLNILETKLNYAYRNGILTEDNVEWMLEHGYINGDGEIELSDAFVAINSGTTRNGNSLIAPLEAIHEKGCIPKHMLPLGKDMTWEEYHDPARITDVMRKLGKEFARRFTVNYKRVYSDSFAEVAEQDMIDTGSYAWGPIDDDGIYQRVNRTPNHAWMLVRSPLYRAFDNYVDYDGDFLKTLAPDYEVLPYGYRVFISKQKDSTTLPESELQELIERFLACVQRLLTRIANSVR